MEISQIRTPCFPRLASAPRLLGGESGRPAGAQVYPDLGVETVIPTVIRAPKKRGAS